MMQMLPLFVKPWNFRGRRTERNAPRGTRCADVGCTAPKPSKAQAKCQTCHETFGGVTHFDRHRKDGWCLDPSTLGLRKNERGVWVRDLTPDEIGRLKAVWGKDVEGGDDGSE